MNLSWNILKQLKPLVFENHKNEFSGEIHTHESYSVSNPAKKERRRGEYIREETCSHGSCVSQVSITRGNGDSAKFYSDVEFTYHTHPIYYYKKYGVKIAPPSGEDIGVFLRGCIEHNSCLHLVLSKEGVYVMYANPCFIEQARRLYERDTKESRTYYEIALVGAEILGMETHECRDQWTVEQWLQWIRNRFVCRTIQTSEYEHEIRQKFNYHCDDCLDIFEGANIEKFQQLFREIVQTSFDLARCSERNEYRGTRWSEGNWLDVEFFSWKRAQDEGGIRLIY